MMINDENKKSISQMLKSKSLYAALGVCLLAAGAVGITSINTNTPDTLSEQVTTEKTTYKNVNDPVFHDNVPEISVTEGIKEAQPITENIPTEKAEEPETQAVFDNNSQTLDDVTESAEPIDFSLPVTGALGRDYSMGQPVFSSTMGDYRTHNGVDIEADAGREVKTAAPGKVTAVISDSVWGNTVEIDHGNGYVSRISGLADEGLIENGAAVSEGQLIGVIGTIPVESKDNPHIHLEIRRNGELQDPLEVLGLTDTTD